ncbi:hypothetical protein ACFRQM_33105 [Streptomyces sp. NPDC056831]|uniref:hypothetical protein n=1 Tax=Streptomyces sp. NPDC056831 TaxID=3345954 RepID=UPI0036AD18F0
MDTDSGPAEEQLSEHQARPDDLGDLNRGARVVGPEAPGVRHMWKYSAAEWGDLPGLARLLDVLQAAIDSAAER